MTEGAARRGDAPRRLSFRQRTTARLIGALGAPVIDAICRSLEWRVEGMEHHDAIVASGRQPILAFWHGRVLHATWFFRGRGIVVMISENFDGEWIARLIHWFGYRTARGSSSRGGARALVRMRRLSVDGAPTGFAVDGPRGPARSVQLGAVWLASLTGQPILPFHAESDRYWTARSWDGTQVPKPFARAAMVIGPPITVPRRPDDDVMEEKRRELADSLATLAERATVMAGVSAQEGD